MEQTCSLRHFGGSDSDPCILPIPIASLMGGWAAFWIIWYVLSRFTWFLGSHLGNRDSKMMHPWQGLTVHWPQELVGCSRPSRAAAPCASDRRGKTDCRLCSFVVLSFFFWGGGGRALLLQQDYYFICLWVFLLVCSVFLWGGGGQGLLCCSFLRGVVTNFVWGFVCSFFVFLGGTILAWGGGYYKGLNN